jgi:hypothetical protein
MAVDATAATGSLRTLGSTATSACAGNDSRLSNARTPTSHASTHNAGGSDALTIDAAAGTGSLRTLGTSATSACAGSDARLSDARTPTAHATSHRSGGSDSIKLDDLASPDDNTDLNATTGQHGLLPKLGGGSTNFLRADGTWATPPGGSDANAIHKNVAAEISTITEKTAPVVADLLIIEDSADSNNKKRVQAGNLPRRWPWGSKIRTVDPDAAAKADYTTITAALAAAVAGDIILIAPGTYAETLTLKDGVALIGMNTSRYGGGFVAVQVSASAPFDLLTKNSAGTAYLEGITFLAVLSGSTTGTTSALNLVSGGVRAKDCLFQVLSTATGTQMLRGIRNAGFLQMSDCSVVASDTIDSHSIVAAITTSATLEADRCKFSESGSASTEGGISISGGTAALRDCGIEIEAGQPIRRSGGTVTLYGACAIDATAETDDTDDPTTSANFPRRMYGAMLSNGERRAYKLPCRAISADPTSPANGDIWYNSTSNQFKAYENGAVVVLRGGSDSDALHKSTANEIHTLTAKATPASDDVFVIEDSADSWNKKRVTVGGASPAYGQNFQSAVEEDTATTTSSTMQTRVTLTTPALTGTYRIDWQAELRITSTSNRFQARLYNNTDGAELCFTDVRPGVSGTYVLVSGFAYVTFAGAAKTFYLQRASQNNSATVTIRRARMDIRRVS